MKKILFVAVANCFAIIIFAQQTSLNDFNKKRQSISKKGLTILSSYAAANIVYGSIAASQTTGSNKYFHEMNALWNGITLSITGLGLLTAKKEGGFTYSTSLKKQGRIEQLFLFNAGLDVAYIAGGAYLKEKSKSNIKNPAKLKGFGESIMLQGGVLFLFDAVMFALHNKHGRLLNKMVEKVQLAGTENGLGLLVKL